MITSYCAEPNITGEEKKCKILQSGFRGIFTLPYQNVLYFLISVGVVQNGVQAGPEKMCLLF